MATLQEQLTEAQTAYHDLLTGRLARVFVDGGDGSRIEYTATTRDALRGYIAELEAKIAAAAQPCAPRGPMRSFFL